MRKILIFLLPIILIVGLKTVNIAEQYGLAYAPLQIAKELKLIEKHLPEHEINWEKTINTASIREAMLSGSLDIGFMGIPPFLIGFDNQMNWKIFRALNQAPLGVTYRTDKITSIDNINSSQKIALPQPGSIQHILLTMYLEKNYGDAKFLDDYLLTLSHPEGQLALLSDSEVVAHFTSPPYLFEELNDGNVELMFGSEEAFGGEFTFIVGVLRDGFEDEEIVDGVNAGIDEAIDIIENNPECAIELLSKVYEIDEDKIHSYLYWEGMNFKSEVVGIDQFIEFMNQQGYLKEMFSIEDVMYEKK